MSSHVVVLDATARRAVVKTNPSKHLSDVLQEACTKLGLDASRHGLKSNNKTIDLSQPFRLSGLSSGAKLQLVVLSRSPSAVSVALQLSENTEGEPSRLTDKLPSTTTLWLLLRHFESGVGGAKSARNYTARALPQPMSGNSGPGRLFYETPLIHVMGRELVSFTDLQKTLAQLGFNSGSVLLRLSFRATERPLEEAMAEIDQYFKSVSGDNTGGAHGGDVGNTESALQSSRPLVDEQASELPSPPEPMSPQSPAENHLPSPEPTTTLNPSQPEAETFDSTSAADNTITGPSQRPITVFAPPSTSTPAAARQAYNERDYEPTVDHAKLHQSRLSSYGRNKTLPSDAELAAQAEAQAKRKAEVRNVKIKVRFPDQSTVVSEFSNIDTTIHLYEHVKGLLENEDDPFSLNFSTPKGPQNIPRNENVKLISGLGMTGSVLVNVIWEAGVSSEARAGKVLKEAFRQKATEIEVKEPEGVEINERDNLSAKGKEAEKREGGGKKGGVPKWLKLPGKK